MKISNIFLALAGATLLSANALADPKAPSLVAYDVNGDGIDEQAYELKSADDLYWFANYVNDMANAEEGNRIYYSSANAVLTANITVNENLLSRLVKDNDGNVTNGEEVKAWFPIGYYNNNNDNVYYAGTFDGNGYTISGLYFNNSSRDDAGLIGLTAEGVVIKNVGVIDSYFKGESNIGGVCGINNGTIENCYNTGEVSGGNSVGGVCGINNGTIENCYNTGKVSGGDGSSAIGGVCGYNIRNCTIKNSYNTGEVSSGDKSYNIGGVCGHNWGTIGNCYNTGKVSGGNESYYIGGVCGHNWGTIGNCYNTGKVSGGNGSNNIGGVCGYNDGIIENCYYLASTDDGNGGKTADQFADGTVAQALRGGTNGNVWGQYIGVDELPKLTGVFCPKQITEGEYAGYYAISNADELYWFSGLVNGKLIGVEQNNSANAVLTDDITINNDLFSKLNEDGTVKSGEEVKAWFPIGYYYDNNGVAEDIYFCGTFDGNGHTISGLYFNNEGQYYVGLFGQIFDGATIKNVGVIDSYFKGNSYVGSVCGYNFSSTIEKCYNTGKVSGGDESDSIGGVCGCSDGTIENCYNRGEVSGGDGSSAIGGVCGYNSGYGTIENCYNRGEVSGGDGSSVIGGVCGFNYYGTIENCYNSGEISGGDESSYIGGVYGFSYGTIKNCYDFKLNSGTLSEYSIVVENNTIALPTEDMVSREGYQFGGWYDNTDCEGDGITSEVEFNDVHTLYAKWTGGSTPTAIKAVEAESNKTIKTIKDGQIVIIRNGVMYDMQGHKLE